MHEMTKRLLFLGCPRSLVDVDFASIEYGSLAVSDISSENYYVPALLLKVSPYVPMVQLLVTAT